VTYARIGASAFPNIFITQVAQRKGIILTISSNTLTVLTKNRNFLCPKMLSLTSHNLPVMILLQKKERDKWTIFRT